MNILLTNEEGWYDLVFNINTKEHQFYRKDPKSRYDLILDKDINLYEYYYGGNLTLPFLDGII